VPLAAKDVVDVLMLAKIPIWRCRVRYSVGRIVNVAKAVVKTVVYTQEDVIIDAHTVASLPKKKPSI
jgi:hypothetical protein